MKRVDSDKIKKVARQAAFVGAISAIICTSLPQKYQQPCAAVAALLQLKCKG
ncbi:hypothetical protein [Caudoviricetes sp.]|jgi:hypothetical protein|nr:hypothetical protein [Caudoviricetes sp.]